MSSPPTFRIFDSHVNIGGGNSICDPIKSNITAEQILELMAESHIERSVIFPASRPEGYAEANKEVAAYVRQYPDRFLGFGRIRSDPVARARRAFRLPGLKNATVKRVTNRLYGRRSRTSSNFAEECQEEVRKCFSEYGLRGIKVHPGEDGYPSRPVLSTLLSNNKPILLHCGRSISLSRIEEEIIKPFNMPVILAHMGGYPADRKLYFKAISLAKKYPHVYLNTSFVFYQYILELAIAACPRKVIFGSDAPGVHPSAAVSTIMPLHVSDEIKQMVLWDNITRLVED